MAGLPVDTVIHQDLAVSFFHAVPLRTNSAMNSGAHEVPESRYGERRSDHGMYARRRLFFLVMNMQERAPQKQQMPSHFRCSPPQQQLPLDSVRCLVVAAGKKKKKKIADPWRCRDSPVTILLSAPSGEG